MSQFGIFFLLSPLNIRAQKKLQLHLLRPVWLKVSEESVLRTTYGINRANWKYRVIHKSLWDFRTRLRNNQDRYGRKEHINR